MFSGQMFLVLPKYSFPSSLFLSFTEFVSNWKTFSAGHLAMDLLFEKNKKLNHHHIAEKFFPRNQQNLINSNGKINQQNKNFSSLCFTDWQKDF